MRIIAGALSGRVFQSPKGHRTHPMSDRVRGAVFNVLGNLDELTVLDVFAGSGALSFEAVSRGAKHSTAIEIDKSAQQTIAQNIDELGVRPKLKLIKANCASWSNNNPEQLFDIIFADPPFDSLQLPTLRKMTRHLQPGGLFVLNWPGKLDFPELADMQIVKQHSYGDAQVAFYRSSV